MAGEDRQDPGGIERPDDVEAAARALIEGRWASQILTTALELGLLDRVGEEPTAAEDVADALDLDPDNTYRLLRALASLGVLDETEGRRFSLTPVGTLFEPGTPFHALTRLTHAPAVRAAWDHLPDIVRDGGPHGFQREFGRSIFEHGAEDPAFGALFNEAMTSSSAVQTRWTLDALEAYDLSRFGRVCDVGGGHGHLLASLLAENPHLDGTVLERPGVIAEEDVLWAARLGVEDRCDFVAGDMLEAVPPADAYFLKRILHDWTDDECVRILENVRESSPSDGRVFVVERVVPGPESPHPAKLHDVNMMAVAGGRERTLDEYEALLERAGWELVEEWKPSAGTISVIEVVRR